jgi:hypothetical protein
MATFSPDSARLVVATFGGVTVLRAGDWTEEHCFRREGSRYPSLPAAFSGDGAILAIGIAKDRVRLVATQGFHTLADLAPAPPHNLFHMRFLQGGRRLAVATPDHRLLIWELEKTFVELAQHGLIESTDPLLRMMK